MQNARNGAINRFDIAPGCDDSLKLLVFKPIFGHGAWKDLFRICTDPKSRISGFSGFLATARVGRAQGWVRDYTRTSSAELGAPKVFHYYDVSIP